MRRTLHGPTTISPVVTRFFWPPLMPRRMCEPTIVSAHTCNQRSELGYLPQRPLLQHKARVCGPLEV